MSGNIHERLLSSENAVEIENRAKIAVPFVEFSARRSTSAPWTRLPHQVRSLFLFPAVFSL